MLKSANATDSIGFGSNQQRLLGSLPPVLPGCPRGIPQVARESLTPLVVRLG